MPAAECPSSAEIRSIEMTPRGLEIKASAPLTARIADYSTTQGEGFQPFSMLTVEIPAVALGSTPSFAQFRQGAFSNMRIVAFRGESDCGLRIRLQPRYPADWRIEPLDDGIRIAPRRTRLFTPSAVLETEEEVERETSLAGGYRVVGSYSATSALGGGSSASELLVGFGQRLHNGAAVRGFFSGLGSGFEDQPLFGAVAVDNIELRNGAIADAAVGDLSVPLGETGLSQGSFFSGVTIRGVDAGIANDRSRLSVFGGRASSGTLLRLAGLGEVASPLTHDHIIGSQWIVRVSDKVGVGVAWTRSLPAGEPSQNNLYESIEWRPQPTHGLRATMEESFRANGPTGFALTVDPHTEGKRLTLTGFYRYTSADFRPALASTLFANLRRSYGLTASYRPTDRLTLNASAMQAKMFSLFDPNTVGTFESSRSVGVGYQLTEKSSVFADYGTADLHTDPGSILPADSRRVWRSVGYSHTQGRTSWLVRYADEETINRLNRALDLRSHRVEGNVTESLRNGGSWIGRTSVASSRRINGVSAGSDYSASLAYNSPMTPRGRYRAAAGFTATPAGYALTSSRQEFVTVGYQPPPGWKFLQGSVDVTYYLLETGSGQRRHIWSVLFNASRLVDWGAGLRPDIPYANRALPIISTFALEDVGRIVLRVFEDRNANGEKDPDEPWLPDVVIRVGERELRTGNDGEVHARVARGPQTIRVAPQAALVDEYISTPEQRVRVTEEPVSVIIPARPAGRVVGRVTPLNGVEKAALESIRIVARGNGLDFETLTDAEGVFRLGPLPAGTYDVEMDTTSLTSDTRASGSTRMTIEMTKGGHVEVAFAIRTATARERVAAP